MIRADTYKGKKIAVFGLARTGLTMAESLSSGGAAVLAFDDDAVNRKASGLKQTDLYDLDFADLDGLAISPGVPLTNPAPHPLVTKANDVGLSVFGDMEIFQAARANLPGHNLAAITGTNGKSTTTALLAHTLETCGRAAAVGGNIGVPVLGLEPLEEGGVYVFELSSFQIDLTRNFKADVAILLNITPDHLDRHGDMSGYVSAKRRLFEMQSTDQVAIIGIDDENGRTIASSLRQRVIPISVEGGVPGGVFVEGSILYDAMEGEPVAKGSLENCGSLKGTHNHQNAAAVYAAAIVLGLDSSKIISAFESFPGLRHRLQPVGRKDHVLYVNDSKASNTGAAAKALAAYDDIYWIAGGRFKEDNLDAILEDLSHLRKAYLIGEAAEDFEKFIAGQVPMQISSTVEQAVMEASSDARNAGGGVVLLAPACASFDQFESFEERGDAFVAAVEQIVGEGT